MSDMKEFLDNNTEGAEFIRKHIKSNQKYVAIDDLFDFHWERGGKKFVYSCVGKRLESLLNTAKLYVVDGKIELNKTDLPSHIITAQDFLDCVEFCKRILYLYQINSVPHHLSLSTIYSYCPHIFHE